MPVQLCVCWQVLLTCCKKINQEISTGLYVLKLMRIYTIVPITEVRQDGLMFIKLPAPYSQSLKWGISLLASTLLIASDQIRFLGPDIPNVCMCCW